MADDNSEREQVGKRFWTRKLKILTTLWAALIAWLGDAAGTTPAPVSFEVSEIALLVVLPLLVLVGLVALVKRYKSYVKTKKSTESLQADSQPEST